MPDYILEPLDTDPEEIFQSFVDFTRQYFPDWEPSEGQLDVIIARYFSMQTAFTADMASRVQRAIFRYFGANLANIQPLPGSSARALIHFTIEDPVVPPQDRSLEFGTLIGFTDRDGDTQIFATVDDMDVPAGSTEAEVTAEAVELGSVANNITGTVELIELVDWIGVGTIVGQSSGGSNPEQDDIYIQRLTENLRLPRRPSLAEDFPIYAQNIPGVWRAAVLDNFRPGVNEVQELTSDYTTGTFTLTFGGHETSDINATATAAQVRDAMDALPNFDITDGDFAGGPLPDEPITITYKGKYGYTDVTPPTIDSSGLSGGTGIAITTTVISEPYGTDMENSIAISGVDEEGNPLSSEIKEQLMAYLQSARSQNFVITFVDPAYHQVDVNYTARAHANHDPDAARTAVDFSLADYLSPANWGVFPQQTQTRNWILQPTVRYLELTTIVENVADIDYTESLVFSLDGSAFDSNNKDFVGPFSLTRPGTINGTINLPI